MDLGQRGNKMKRTHKVFNDNINSLANSFTYSNYVDQFVSLYNFGEKFENNEDFSDWYFDGVGESTIMYLYKYYMREFVEILDAIMLDLTNNAVDVMYTTDMYAEFVEMFENHDFNEDRYLVLTDKGYFKMKKKFDYDRSLNTIYALLDEPYLGIATMMTFDVLRQNVPIFEEIYKNHSHTKRVVDISCGAGYQHIIYANAGISYIGCVPTSIPGVIYNNSVFMTDVPDHHDMMIPSDGTVIISNLGLTFDYCKYAKLSRYFDVVIGNMKTSNRNLDRQFDGKVQLSKTYQIDGEKTALMKYWNF